MSDDSEAALAGPEEAIRLELAADSAPETKPEVARKPRRDDGSEKNAMNHLAKSVYRGSLLTLTRARRPVNRSGVGGSRPIDLEASL